MDFKLGSDGDLVFENNDLVLVDGQDAIKQNLTMRLQEFYGEWFADSTVGVPWFSEILLKNVSLLVVQEILKAVILETRNITDIISFTFDLENREATLSTKALSTNGIIDFSIAIDL